MVCICTCARACRFLYLRNGLTDRVQFSVRLGTTNYLSTSAFHKLWIGYICTCARAGPFLFRKQLNAWCWNLVWGYWLVRTNSYKFYTSRGQGNCTCSRASPFSESQKPLSPAPRSHKKKQDYLRCTTRSSPNMASYLCMCIMHVCLLRASAKREASFYWYTLKIWVWAAVVTLLRGLYLWNRKPDWQAVFFGG